MVVVRPQASCLALTGKSAPAFSELVAQRATLWSKPAWAKGVLVHNEKCGGSRGPQLHTKLMSMTARSCRLCDAGGGAMGLRPRAAFTSDRQLQDHLLSEHNRQVGGRLRVCEASHVFIRWQRISMLIALSLWSDRPLSTETHPSLTPFLSRSSQLCQLCLEAGTKFTQELDVYDRPAMDQHVRRCHPRCEFCR